MEIVLYEPEIPLNVGAIGRISVITGSPLHLIRPYGFIMSDKHMKKAGLDYWADVEVYEYNSFEDFLEKQGDQDLFIVSTKGKTAYDQIKYPPKTFFLFGRESKGLPAALLERYQTRTLRVPMGKDKRSLNLSVTVGIVIYEALRQSDFTGLI